MLRDLYAIFLVFCLQANGQCQAPFTVDQDLRERYQQIRQRLFQDFYVEGRIAEQRWNRGGVEVTKFSDNVIYQGMMLAMLSAELAIEKRDKLPPGDSLDRIREILDAIDVLSEHAAKIYSNSDADPNGYFVRDDISPGTATLGNRFALVESEFSDRQLRNAEPSADQILGLFFGLGAVVRHCDDPDVVEHAKRIAERIYGYVERNRFILKRPDGETVKRGADMRLTSSLLHGFQRDITGNDRFRVGRLDLPEIPRLPRQLSPGLTWPACFWNDSGTPKMFSELAGQSVSLDTPAIPLFPRNQIKLEVPSFLFHQILMAVAVQDLWPPDQFELVAESANHELASLVMNSHRGSMPNWPTAQHVNDLLMSLPSDGPNSDNLEGWGRDNRWIRCTELNEKREPSNYTRYNGLDWLLLASYACLMFSEVVWVCNSLGLLTSCSSLARGSVLKEFAFIARAKLVHIQSHYSLLSSALKHAFGQKTKFRQHPDSLNGGGQLVRFHGHELSDAPGSVASDRNQGKA